VGCLGVHFAIPAAEAEKLLAFTDEAALLEYVREELEEKYFDEYPEWLAESDKAWDGMHRVLGDGTMDWDSGDTELGSVILGGERLYFQPDHVMVLKGPKTVDAAAAALAAIDEEWFRARYFTIDSEECGYPITEGDFDYTWTWFQVVRDLWLRAAAVGRYVLFTASQ
jgi:hypothetical protein